MKKQPGWLVVAAAGLSIAAVIGTSVACSGKAVEPYKDAPVGSQNSAPADGILFPDGFSNVSTKCDHHNRVYVAFHGDSKYAAIAVVPGDPSCK